LNDCEEELRKRGVQDIKFFFSPGVSAFPLSEVREGVREFLSDYLNGNYKVVKKINDSACTEGKA
jgi:hypothetical protein